jgi:hypothetical protein
VIAPVLILLLAAAVRVYGPETSVDGYQHVPAPNIQMRMSQASATTVPWIDSNASRFMRGVRKAYYDKLPPGTAALAAAEAHAWGVDAILQPAPEDKQPLDSMMGFLQKVGNVDLPVRANIGIIDDGSPELPEVLNLLSRRTLLYKVVKAPDPKLDLNVKIGSEQFPKDAVRNPNDFAARVREKLTDDKRLVRLFGTYTVLANLTGDAKRSRLHLVNYSKRPVKDVRVRVLGNYAQVRLAEANDPMETAVDVAQSEGGTEFTVPLLTTYAVVDLQ